MITSKWYEIIQNEYLPRTQLRDEHCMEKGQKDVPIGKAVARHRGAPAIESQRPQYGDTAAAIDGLGRIGALATWGTGIVPGHR
jgi:hypothetical protein